VRMCGDDADLHLVHHAGMARSPLKRR
jgi:hypothetical protein